MENNGRTEIGDAVLAKVNQELADKNLSESEIRQLIDTLIQQEMDQRPELEDIYFVWFGRNIAHNTKTILKER